MTNPYFGQRGVGTAAGRANAHDFTIRQHVHRVRTMIPVKVVSVSADGNSVDVQPLVNQVDGVGKKTPHGTVFSISVHHFQGGNGQFKVTPVVGDMGMIMCSDRDISSVLKAKGPANPGSNRTHDMADAVYMGGFGNINGTPTNSMVWGPNGLTITVGSASYVFGSTGVAVTGTITATQEITAGQGGSDSVTLQQHVHAANNTHPTAGT